ncbi:rhodopsin-like [Ostrea edulis]|uniref:rhodopsin-like n=1 Tax=Ostrea edulis TaxID=37623 RepID=UPI0020950268|nr:rhodopsin-like [Ostrea edulis]
MAANIFLEHNMEGRRERAPLGAVSYLLNISGIIGNVLVLHVFRTRFSRSLNYRTFVLFLAFVDLFTCIAHIAKELNRMISVYNQLSDKAPFMCEISHYVGNSVGVASFFIVMFITFERYRKICTPFKPQIMIKHSRIMCVCTVLISFAINFPIYLIHGKRNVVVGGINATRCSTKNEYDGVMLPFLYHVLIFALVVVCFPVVVIFQLKIRNALVRKTNSKKKMKNINSNQKSENPTSVNEKDTGKNVKKDKSKRKAAADDDEDKRNRRIAITFAIVSLFLMVSFFTHTLYEFIKSLDKYLTPRQEISKTEDILEEYLPDIITINGILNPFVYLFTDAQFKQELMKLCGRGV